MNKNIIIQKINLSNYFKISISIEILVLSRRVLCWYVQNFLKKPLKTAHCPSLVWGLVGNILTGRWSKNTAWMRNEYSPQNRIHGHPDGRWSTAATFSPCCLVARRWICRLRSVSRAEYSERFSRSSWQTDSLCSSLARYTSRQLSA